MGRTLKPYSLTLDDDIIECLREIRNNLMENNLLSVEMLDNIFLNFCNDANKTYLISDGLKIYHNVSDVNSIIFIFKQLLQSEDPEDIEYVLSEMVKMDSYLMEFNDIIPLIVQSINNNNVNVKKLSVMILSKFSKFQYVQKCIFEYSEKGILRILSLIDFDSFLNISYNLMMNANIAVYGVHYNAMKKYIVQNLVDEYDREHYEEETNYVWSLIKKENKEKNIYFQKEQDLISLINDNLDELKEDGLEYEDMIIIAKSKQILDFQIKTECSLLIQSFIRGQNARNQFLKLLNEKKSDKNKRKELLSENIRLTNEYNMKQNENMQKNDIIKQQQKQIEELQEMIKKLNEKEMHQENIRKNDLKNINLEMEKQKKEIDSLKNQNFILKQDQIKKQNEMKILKKEHLADKQQFAIKMMNEMNKLRDDLKNIGINQQQQQSLTTKQQTTSSYFGGLF